MTVICTICKKSNANYKKKGRGQPLLCCVKCKKEKMVRVTNTCEAKGCSVRATYNFPGSTKGMFCKKDSLDGMLDVQNKRCLECRRQPSYNFEGRKPALYCSKHKKPNMVDIKSKRCAKEGCRKSPTYNFSGKKALYCAEDALEGMVDVKNRKCKECSNQPSFNYPGESVSTHCGNHYLAGMVDIRHPKCQRIGCNTRPTYNFEGFLKGIYCEEDAEEGMIDVESKRCVYEDKNGRCQTRPSFNYEGQKSGLVCKKHKLQGMVSISGSRCKKCGKQAIFNLEGEYKGKFCYDCKTVDMVDVVNKKCDQCHKSATFGFLFSSLDRCSDHKTFNMVPSGQRFPKCLTCHVKDAYYAPPGMMSPDYCEDHAPRSYINIVEKPCSLCGLSYFIPEDQDLCQDCRGFSDPKIFHSKEIRIKNVLKTNGIDITSHDSKPKYACSQYRPDFVLDYGLFVIIVEVDENQHETYIENCENIRMYQLYQEFGGTPVFFIRYNPDDYIDHLDERHKGFKENPRREKRLLNLIRKIKKKKEIPLDPSVYYLFYDGDDGVDRMKTLYYSDLEFDESE